MWIPLLVSFFCFWAGVVSRPRIAYVWFKLFGKPKLISSERVISELHTWNEDQWGGLNCQRCKLVHKTEDQTKWATARNEEHMLFHVSRGYLPWEDVPEGWRTWLLQHLEDFPEAELQKIAHVILDGGLEVESVHEMLQARVREQMSLMLGERLKIAQADPDLNLSNVFDLEERKRQVEKGRTAA